jgi:CRISPR type I-E-associated protein CasB/Cse2
MTTQSDPQMGWGQIARHWWRELQDTNKDGSRNRTRNPAALARLRRAAVPAEALEEPSIFDLYRRLGFARRDIERCLTRVAVVAAVLAHIRSDASPSDTGYRRGFAEMLGGENAIMSPLRFRRLLEATEDRDLLIVFRRAVALAGAQQPRTLGSAFAQPVRDGDVIDASVAKLEAFQQNMDKAYGACADDRYSMRVGGKGTLAEAIAFATSW